MNYYQHHIGDFNSATRCLTRVERSVYRDLIELYYDKEEPLSGNIKFLQKLVLAVSDEEKEALNTVLEMFFTYEDDQFRNSRCDSEIEKYQSNQSAKAKAGRMSAAKRKRNSTRVEHVNNECATNQEPITNNQEPILKDILSSSDDQQLPIEVEPKKPRLVSDELLAKITEYWNELMAGISPSIDLLKKNKANQKRIRLITEIVKTDWKDGKYQTDYRDHDYWAGYIQRLATSESFAWQRENKQLHFDQAMNFEKFERNLGIMRMEANR